MRDRSLLDQLKRIVGDAYVVHEPDGLIAFEYDGSVDRALPEAVVLPSSTAEVSGVMASRALVGAFRRARGEES